MRSCWRCDRLSPLPIMIATAISVLAFAGVIAFAVTR
jgi:hypothetical protein